MTKINWKDNLKNSNGLFIDVKSDTHSSITSKELYRREYDIYFKMLN